MTSFRVLAIAIIAVLLRPVNSAYLTTKYELGPAIVMKEFTAAGNLSGNMFHVVTLPIYAIATSTGSATVESMGKTGVVGTKYASICIPNPLRMNGTGTGKLFFNRGSGIVLRADWFVIKGPGNVGGDIGFVDGCESGTGDTLINNACSGTGCRSSYTEGTADWDGNDFIKVGLRGDPGNINARLSVSITDNGAE